MEIATIYAFLARRQEIEAAGSQEERDCLKGLDALVALSPDVLTIIGDISLISGSVVEIAPEETPPDTRSGEEEGNALPILIIGCRLASRVWTSNA